MIKKILQEKIKILSNSEINKGYSKIILGSSRMARLFKPGQFIEIKVSDACEPFLRRPFSIHRFKGFTTEILYEVVGNGTRILSQRKPGEYLDVIGPLGNGFDYTSQVAGRRLQVAGRRSHILVAGGMGVAPLLFLAEKLMSSPVKVLIGAKTKKQLLCEKEFKDLGCEVKIATDDGSKGFKGYVSELLNKVLSAIDYPRLSGRQELSIVYACGPRPMLKEIALVAKKYNISSQVSLEEHMACGIGACLGCVVNTVQGFKRVCKEGPVFNADEIIW